MRVTGFDVGTSGLKGVVIDEAGAIVAEHTASYEPSSPRPGWSEQDPETWWAAFLECSRRLVDSAGPPQAIGLSGQMHGSVFLGADDRSVSPAILWNDQRTAAECEQIWSLTDRKVVDWTLNEPRTAFTASKMLWLRNARPDRFEATRTVLLPKDFIRFRLSGERLSDVTDASGTNLLDVARRDWSSPMLQALGFDRSLLPDLVESAEPAGAVLGTVVEATGLRAGTTIVGGGADQACAAIGNGIVRTGALSVTLGTSGVVYAQLSEIALDRTGAFHTFCHSVPGTWMMMAGVLSAAGSFEWYRRTVGAADADHSIAAGGGAFDGIVRAINEVEPGSGGLIFLPYLTGERAPHNDPFARGAWFGLTRRHGRPHMARAVIEGVCFAIRDLVEIVEAMGIEIAEVRVAGGAARGRVWLEILASVLGRPVRATTTPDASAYGAALLALAQATGASVAEVSGSLVTVGPLVEPDPSANAIYQDMHAVYRALYPATRSAMHALSAIDARLSGDGQ